MDKGKSLSMSEVKNLEIGILDYIDNICKKHNLKYMLDYGTLLGAIRHKGFIPWDDDIDISMPRKDYEKLIEILSKEQSRYKLLCHELDSDYIYEFAKVIDTHTILNETVTIGSNNMGVWVDIFPYDNIPKFKSMIHSLILFALMMRVFAVQPKFPEKHSKLFYPCWIIARLIGYKCFLKMIHKLSTLSKNKNTPYIGYLPLISKHFYWNKDMFEKLTEVEFEGKKYPGPQQYDSYLKDVYGDYMQLTPEDKRIPHPMEAWWKKGYEE